MSLEPERIALIQSIEGSMDVNGDFRGWVVVSIGSDVIDASRLERRSTLWLLWLFVDRLEIVLVFDGFRGLMVV